MPRFIIISLLGVAVLAALIVLSVVLGTTQIPLLDVANALKTGLGLSAEDPTPMQRIVFDLRLPRALFAAVIGAGLGIVGIVLQTTTRNDLADPFLFGLSSGAAAGAVLVITVTGDVLGMWTLPLAAFCGGIVASVIVLALGVPSKSVLNKKSLKIIPNKFTVRE